MKLTRLEGTKHGNLISLQMLDVAIRVESTCSFACNQMVNKLIMKTEKTRGTFYRQFFLKMLIFLFVVQILQLLPKYCMLLHAFVVNVVRK